MIMEEPSCLSGGISDSNSSNLQFTGGAASASKFKGVVSQSNGHWGAQIYANHQRIWLGTFKSEKEAAMAYDSAAIKLRDGLSHRNFPWTEITIREPDFQNQFSTETVLNMIKDGSYAAKFSDYLRVQDRKAYSFVAFHDHNTPGIKFRQLFQKELTPSDVSKLNRLVIPKKHALKYFPQVSDVKENIDGCMNDLELVFYDRSMSSWKFRYCYWKSSQSFVFTRGWNRFAKEKGLKPTDKVIFYSYEFNNQKMCIIDVSYNNDGATACAIREGDSHNKALEAKIHDSHPNEVDKMDLQHEFEENVNEIDAENVNEIDEENDGYGDMKENLDSYSIYPQKKGLKLFGVQII